MKNCKSCNNCKMLYARYVSFFKINKYYCTEHKKITETDLSCSKWSKRVITFDISLKRFDEVEQDIKLLQQYLK